MNSAGATLASSKARRWLKLRARMARWLPPSEQRAAYGWACCAGLIAAACVLVIRAGLHGVQWLLTQSHGTLIEASKALPEWRRLATPAVGGLLAGLLVLWGRRFTRDQPVADYMEAVTVGDGVVRGRPALLRTLAALFSIGSGGSLGREGPLLQLSTALVSSLGRHLGLRPPRLPLTVACAAAAALAATYHAPLASALFVAEIVLGTIAFESFGPIVLASVIAVAVTRPVLGSAALFPDTVFRFRSPWELPLYLALGIILGVAAPAFVRLIANARRSFEALRLPLHFQLGLGGLVVGAISLVVPEVWGNGFESMLVTLRGDSVTTRFLLIFLVAKIAATAASVGSGAIGGVFTPVMLLGAVGGWIFGAVLGRVFPDHASAPAAYALIGVGAFLAACTHAPLTAVVMVFELTLNPDAILPLLLATVAAHATARSISGESIYSAHLKSRRTETLVPPDPRTLHRPPPPLVGSNASLEEIAAAFKTGATDRILVVNPAGKALGIIHLGRIREHLSDPDLAHLVTAEELAETPIHWVAEDSGVGVLLSKFTEHDEPWLLVMAKSEPGRVVAQVSRRDAMLMAAHGNRW